MWEYVCVPWILFLQIYILHVLRIYEWDLGLLLLCNVLLCNVVFVKQINKNS